MSSTHPAPAPEPVPASDPASEPAPTPVPPVAMDEDASATVSNDRSEHSTAVLLAGSGRRDGGRSFWRASRALTRAGLLKAGEFCHTSPFAAVAPWIGTLVGSWIVGANTGSVSAIIIGAVVAGVGCTPVAAAAQWVKTRGNRARRQDARERKVMEYASLVLLPHLGEFSHLTAEERIGARDVVLVDTVDYLQNNVFRDEEKSQLKTALSTRVVLHAFGTTPNQLEVVYQAGRPDPATVFDLSDGGRGAKVLDDLLGGITTYSSQLVGRNYVSYVSAPIITGDDAIYGMISVDTTDIRQLDTEDGYALEVIASALAVFYQEAEHA